MSAYTYGFLLFVCLVLLPLQKAKSEFTVELWTHCFLGWSNNLFSSYRHFLWTPKWSRTLINGCQCIKISRYYTWQSGYQIYRSDPPSSWRYLGKSFLFPEQAQIYSAVKSWSYGLLSSSRIHYSKWPISCGLSHSIFLHPLSFSTHNLLRHWTILSLSCLSFMTIKPKPYPSH